MTHGVLYKATGKEYIREVEMSAKSVKENTNDLNTAIITDCTINSKYIDKVIEPQNPLENDNSSNILYPDASPYDRTIYLDTDTYICEDISHLTNILDDFNMGVTISNTRHDVPDKKSPFTAFSGGVLIFDSSKKTREFHKKWYKSYWQMRNRNDVYQNQPSLSYAIFESDVDFYTLPSEYNTYINIGSDVGYLYRSAKILHGRPQELAPIIATKLNREDSLRVYYVSPSLIDKVRVKIIQPSSHSVPKKVYRSLLTNGVIKTIKKISEKISTK